jgi:3-hydroxy-9,10-secoandrosta-1,3,5(10)-triene-9,17-dione monooxygenase reductase component
MGIGCASFRRIMGCFATGVTVVTTRQQNGLPCGLTANAVTSVSLDPPLILVCVDKKAESYPHFGPAGVFAVNVLEEGQEAISSRFAVSGGDKFAGIAYHWGETGSPILDRRLAYLECRIVHAYEGGDHTIYVGEVERADAGTGRPLLYYRGAYGALADSRESKNVPKSRKAHA